jgi:hypothetical protein
MPVNDKNPSPPLRISKKLRSKWFSTFYGPNAAAKVREPKDGVNGF